MSPKRPSPLHLALTAAVVLAALFFAYRGPARALREGNYDAALVYGSARAWLVGRNPYDSGGVSRAWLGAGGPPERDPMLTRKAAVLLYPPATFVVLAPVAALPWRGAEVAWVVLGTALWVVTLGCVARLAGLRWGSVGGKTLWAIGLAFAPAHTCIAHGQTAILAVAGVALALVAGRVQGTKSVLSAALFALGAAVKPQVAALYIVHQGGRRQWLVAGVALTVLTGVFGVGVLRMEVNGVAWLTSWKANLDAFTLLDDGNPTSANPLRFQLINLHFLLHTVIADREHVKWATILAVGGLCAAYFAVDFGKPTRRSDLSALAMVGVASLLVTYHRAYDAVVLVFALGWALGVLTDTAGSRVERRLALAGLACVLVFMVPGGSILNAIRPRFASWPIPTTVWDSLLLPHAVWALLALAVVLIAARAMERNPVDGAGA